MDDPAQFGPPRQGVSRRTMLGGGAALLATAVAGCAGTRVPGADKFVRRSGTQFRIGGQPYRFAGANIWYGAYLGADAPFGNRDRLRRELDALKALGVGNLRLLASSELSPLKNSITPAFRDQSASYNRTLLEGLDFTLAEMGRRDMHAVLYLTNFWEWSGGMQTYLYWTNGGRYIDMNDPAHPWPQFPDANAAFYNSPRAIGMYHDYVRAVVGRTNRLTGRRYADDAAIMSWQLANEPRPGGSDAVGKPNLPAFYAWITGTARLIKRLDPNHLVSTGSEGLQGCLGLEACVDAAHGVPEIDYVTAHIWPQNWGWADPANLAGTWSTVETNTREYIGRHVVAANRLDRPLVIEEFGFPRDRGLYDPGTPTTYKDRFYRLIYEAVAESARADGPIAGSNFWAWSGEGRAAHADHKFVRGDLSYLGDPPHEPQGWYGVEHADESSKALIRAHAAGLANMRGKSSNGLTPSSAEARRRPRTAATRCPRACAR
jgi:mannan endo-1,4-beta-mannosidase